MQVKVRIEATLSMNHKDVPALEQAGADAVLIGSALMESDSVFEKTKEFVQSFCWR